MSEKDVEGHNMDYIYCKQCRSKINVAPLKDIKIWWGNIHYLPYPLINMSILI
jgi:hypothetical protein